jgi:four helix bundle protein
MNQIVNRCLMTGTFNFAFLDYARIQFRGLRTLQSSERIPEADLLPDQEAPSHERYNLESQMRRAATSLTNNIAEGHGRFHYQENIQFLRISRGSLEEVLDDLNICLAEQYFPEVEITALKVKGYDLLRKINSYIAYLRSRKAS